ncbi:FtsX-like permease family protein [bacterium]|nr:FtsX-like permease family protein [bacterium]MBU1064678.1 FtsX-like permease family protein [bacterium]MBU1634939.1 FtsX-like permease family protein [bacterium]MBU1875346.1 FtsX-like permease family protein [bacterium]
MLALKLAYRNLMGARLRTWLNVIVLSLAFVVIIWFKGVINGWDQQARRDTIDWQIGGGQYWQENYDPYDPFSIEDSHAPMTETILKSVEQGELAPILISQATMYPEGRIQSISLRGISPDQKVIELPTSYLVNDENGIPAIIGERTARNNKLAVGDYVTIRWRDVNGIFDADEVKIVHIFKTNVPVMDLSIVWIPLEKHQEMAGMPGEATILITSKETGFKEDFPGWNFKDHYFLLSEIREMIEMKSVGGSVYFVVLMSLAMLAIFDTQVLSIFRRQKEIGTHIALGMTQRQVVTLFTVEGAMHSVLAAILATIYGAPLLWLQAVVGWSMPAGTDDFGLTIAETIYPAYSLALVLGSTMIVLITTTIVSYIPARRIAKMNPTDAIRGKIQ